MYTFHLVKVCLNRTTYLVLLFLLQKTTFDPYTPNSKFMSGGSSQDVKVKSGSSEGGGGSAATFQDKVAASMKNLHSWAQNLEANIIIIAKQHNKLCEVVGKEKTEPCLLKVVPPPTFSSSSSPPIKMDEDDTESKDPDAHEKGAEKGSSTEEIPDAK